jgi:hypothetical protein
MKPVWILVVVLASVSAGGAGGYVGSILAAPGAEAPRVDTALSHGVDHSEDLHNQAESIAQLNKRMDNEFAKLRGDQRAFEDTVRTDLAKEKARVDNLKVSAPSDTGETPDVAEVVNSPDFDAKVEAAFEKMQEKRRAEERESREKQMTEWANNQRKQVLDKMVETLKLTTDQQTKVEAILTDYSDKRRDVFTRSREARDNGQTFDMRAEFQTVETAAQDQVRATLLGGQLQQFNELVGEGSMNDIAGGRGWGGGGQGNRNRGNGGGNGGNRRGNGDGNNN